MNALNTPAMQALKQRLADPEPKPKRITTMADPPPRRPERRDRDRPYRPHTDHLREFTVADGRTILADRRGLCFAIAAKPHDFGGQAVTILAFRSSVKGVPVLCDYDVVKAWWLGKPATAENASAKP
jgi:hypothetical protein